MLQPKLLRYVVSLLLLPGVWLGLVFPVGGLIERAAMADSDQVYGLECGRRLSEPSADGVTLVQSVRVGLVVDEEWRAQHIDGDLAARSLLVEASSLFRGLGIHLLPIRIVDWVSPNDLGSARELAVAAQASVPRGDADIMIVLTAQPFETSQDGYAEVGGRYAVAGHHPGHPERDLMVVAHETSHLFGAHHGCDVRGLEGLMAQSGFDDPVLICPCIRRVLERNAERFHQPAP